MAQILLVVDNRMDVDLTLDAFREALFCLCCDVNHKKINQNFVDNVSGIE